LEASILVVFPVERTSYNRVALSNKSGKLVRLPRFRASSTAVIFNGGGLRLARPEVLDALELGEEEGGFEPELGKSLGERLGLGDRLGLGTGEFSEAGGSRLDA
jgi:hypothetical protein